MPRKPLTVETIQKQLNVLDLLPSFYVCPYADPNPGQATDYSLVYFPDPSIACDINLAFFTPDDNKTAGTFGNTVSDTYLRHLRDRSAIIQFSRYMQTLKRRIFTSYIDAPTIHWDAVNVENFVRNTEGEILPDGTVLTNDLMESYQPIGRMWDAETPTPQQMATVMKACFLRGIQRDPDNYVFIYTTYANRDIDQIILNAPIDPNGDAVDKVLYALGFRQISDFITMRGNLSFLETMSYGADAATRFQEADAYALQLAKGDSSQLNAMRKFISIGVAPGLTAQADALAIGSACDPNKPEGYGRFMVWAGNCPAGVQLFNDVLAARTQPLPESVTSLHWSAEMLAEKLRPHAATSGNKMRFFPKCAESEWTVIPPDRSITHARDAFSNANSNPVLVIPVPGLLNRLTLGYFG